MGYLNQIDTSVRIQLRDTVLALEDALDRLREHLQEQSPAVVVTDSEANRADAIAAITRTFYTRDQKPGEVTRTPGLVVTTRKRIPDLVHEANEAKQAFRQARLTFQRAAGRKTGRGRDRLLNVALRQMHRNRICFLQCDRKIHVLPQDTRRVGFSWASGARSIRKTSVEQVRQEYERLALSGAEVERELEILASLPSTLPLAIARPRATHIRANAVTDGDERFSVLTSIPLIVLRAPGDAHLPEFNTLPPSPPEPHRKRRSDQRVSDEPLFPESHIYPYLEHIERFPVLRGFSQNP